MEHAPQRREEIEKILASEHPRRIVVAGPGTGKSYLFQRAIAEERRRGKSKFLALTFIGKLGDALADDLAGLAYTTTLHGFARGVVLAKYGKGWHYYPRMKAIIDEDLKVLGVAEPIAGAKYQERSRYYKGVGDEDVVWHAVQVCKADPSNIPLFDLILVDEFQDFNETEAELVELLATRNRMLVVGDDDQALYEFKGSSPKYIRDRHKHNNKEWESHSLRFCSRCTDVVVKAFHGLVADFELNDKRADRVKKDYVCFFSEVEGGGKQRDSELNPRIQIVRNVKPGGIAYFVQKTLADLLATQKIKTALVIGEGRTCRQQLEGVAALLRGRGFKNIDYQADDAKPFQFKGDLLSGYEILGKENNDLLAWRLISRQLPEADRIRAIKENYSNPEGFLKALPSAFMKLHGKNADTYKRLLQRSPSGRKEIADRSIESLKKEIVASSKPEREILIDQLVLEKSGLPRPLNGVEITVTNILRSKGLGADVVFLVGFDRGKFPMKAEPESGELYQMLVALTRTKKRIYLLNTIGTEVSGFLHGIPKDLIEMSE